MAVADDIIGKAALEHTAIEQDFKSVVKGHKVAAPGHLTGCPAESDVHVASDLIQSR